MTPPPKSRVGAGNHDHQPPARGGRRAAQSPGPASSARRFQDHACPCDAARRGRSSRASMREYPAWPFGNRTSKPDAWNRERALMPDERARRKELLAQYKQAAPDAGVFRIVNRHTNRALLGSSLNLASVANKVEFARHSGSPGALDHRLRKDFEQYRRRCVRRRDSGPTRDHARHDRRADPRGPVSPRATLAGTGGSGVVVLGVKA